MVARNETIFKWTLYGAATLLCLMVQGFFLQRISLWGTMPFLYPVLAAVVATYERPLSGTIYGLVLGFTCDLLLAGPIPCFYTLVFPLVSLCAAGLAQGLLSTGLLCSLAASVSAFVLTDGFHCFLLWVQGSSAWQAGFSMLGREVAVSAAFVVPVSLLFRAVHRRTERDN
ncbi:MAG: hypothetical protein RR350_04685 [Oscillibacter sp.]